MPLRHKAPSFSDPSEIDLDQANERLRAILKGGDTRALMAALKDRELYDPALVVLGLVRLGRLDEAASTLSQQRSDADALLAGATLAFASRALESAWQSVQAALAADPTSLDALELRARILIAIGQHGPAEAELRKILATAPDRPMTHIYLAGLKLTQNAPGEAIPLLEAALALSPGCVEAQLNRGVAARQLNRYREAAHWLRQALRLRPEWAAVHSNLCFAMDHDPTLDTPALQDERHRWWLAHRPAQAAPPIVRDPDPNRRIRVGYVSADFREHAASYGFEALFLFSDRRDFELFAYSNAAFADATTERLKHNVQAWRQVEGLSDDALEAQIRADGIDILVDLSGHSAGNRLPLFARRPAPVIATGWGYITGTGIPFDAFFLDPVVLPADQRRHFAERIVDLPCSHSYMAPAHAPAVARSPVVTRSAISFGSFNRPSKFSAETLDDWGAILRAVPDSRFVAKYAAFDSTLERERLLGELSRRGIAAERVQVMGSTPHQQHLAAMAEIDIALDPAPFGGGISTFEALWMGVPVLTLAGGTIPGRLTASIVSAIGEPDWVARDRADYVRIALDRSRDAARLDAERATRRERMAASIILRHRDYVALVEAEYRRLWHAALAR